MPKGYFLSAHRSPANPEKRKAYIDLAGPAIVKAGGKILASTNIIDAHENGVVEQTVLIEFENVEKAKSAYKVKITKWLLKPLMVGQTEILEFLRVIKI